MGMGDLITRLPSVIEIPNGWEEFFFLDEMLEMIWLQGDRHLETT